MDSCVDPASNSNLLEDNSDSAGQKLSEKKHIISWYSLSNEKIQAMMSSEEYGQAHLFEGQPSEALFEQIKHLNWTLPGGIINYINNSKKLFVNSSTGQSPFEGWQPKVPSGYSVNLENTAEVMDYEASGIPELGKCCFVMVAGGLGERLGYSSIKIGLPVELVTGTSFVEYYSNHILEYEKRSGEVIPFAIMTSGDTHDLTVSLLEEKSNFGLRELSLMKQELVPAMIDSSAKFSMKNGLIEAKPHGHGDVMSLVHSTGLAKKWKIAGKKWVIFLQDTNAVWMKILPAFLGVSAQNNLLFNFLTFARVPKEQVGGIMAMTKGDQTRIQSVEYNQIDALLKNAGHSEGDTAKPGTNISPYPGNINTLLISLPEFADVLEQTGGGMPEFVNPKYADDTKTVFKSPARLECMMQDYPLLLNDFSKVSFTQFDRLFSFSATKNSIEAAVNAVAYGIPPWTAGSNEVDFYRCNQTLLELGGAKITGDGPVVQEFADLEYSVGPKIVINPSFAISLTDIKNKVNPGWEISFRSTLVLSCLNPVTQLTLDGAVHLTENVTSTTSTSETKFPEFIPVEAGDPEHLQIRGFKLSNKDKICNFYQANIDQADKKPSEKKHIISMYSMSNEKIKAIMSSDEYGQAHLFEGQPSKALFDQIKDLNWTLPGGIINHINKSKRLELDSATGLISNADTIFNIDKTNSASTAQKPSEKKHIISMYSMSNEKIKAMISSEEYGLAHLVDGKPSEALFDQIKDLNWTLPGGIINHINDSKRLELNSATGLLANFDKIFNIDKTDSISPANKPSQKKHIISMYSMSNEKIKAMMSSKEYGLAHLFEGQPSKALFDQIKDLNWTLPGGIINHINNAKRLFVDAATGQISNADKIFNFDQANRASAAQKPSAKKHIISMYSMSNEKIKAMMSSDEYGLAHLFEGQPSKALFDQIKDLNWTLPGGIIYHINNAKRLFVDAATGIISNVDKIFHLDQAKRASAAQKPSAKKHIISMYSMSNEKIKAIMSSEEYGLVHLVEGQPSKALFDQIKHLNWTLPGGIINHINNAKRLFVDAATGQISNADKIFNFDQANSVSKAQKPSEKKHIISMYSMSNEKIKAMISSVEYGQAHLFEGQTSEALFDQIKHLNWTLPGGIINHINNKRLEVNSATGLISNADKIFNFDLTNSVSAAQKASEKKHIISMYSMSNEKIKAMMSSEEYGQAHLFEGQPSEALFDQIKHLNWTLPGGIINHINNKRLELDLATGQISNADKIFNIYQANSVSTVQKPSEKKHIISMYSMSNEKIKAIMSSKEYGLGHLVEGQPSEALFDQIKHLNWTLPGGIINHIDNSKRLVLDAATGKISNADTIFNFDLANSVSKAQKPSEKKHIISMYSMSNERIKAMLSSEEYGQAHLFEGQPSETLFDQIKHLNWTLPGGIINPINNSRRLFVNSATGQLEFENKDISKKNIASYSFCNEWIQNMGANLLSIKQIFSVLQSYPNRISLKDYVELCQKLEIRLPMELFSETGTNQDQSNPGNFVSKKNVALGLIVICHDLIELKLDAILQFVEATPRGKCDFIEYYLRLLYVYLPRSANKDLNVDVAIKRQVVLNRRQLPNLILRLQAQMLQHSNIRSALRSTLQDPISPVEDQPLQDIQPSETKPQFVEVVQKEEHKIQSVEADEEEFIEFSAPIQHRKKQSVHGAAPPAPHPIADVPPKESEQDKGNEGYKSPLDVEEDIPVDSSDIQEFWAWKKMNFVRMKLWDDEKFLELARHRTILNNIYHRLKSHAKSGREDNDLKIKFLKMASDAESSYGKDLGDLLSFLPLATKGPETTMKSGLTSVHNFHKNLIEKIKNFKHTVDNVCIKEQMTREQQTFDKTCENWEKSIAELMQKLDVNNREAATAFQDYINCFGRMEIQINNGKPVEECLWIFERKFLTLTKASIQLQQDAAHLLVKTWNEFVTQDWQRHEAIQKVMMTYMTARVQIHESLGSVRESIESLKVVDHGQHLLSENKFISAEEAKLARDQTGEQEVQKALENWKIPSQPKSNLVMLAADLHRKTGKEKSWKRRFVVVTRDHFLHFFNNRDEITEPQTSINLSKSTVKCSLEKKEDIIEIGPKMSSFAKLFSKDVKEHLLFPKEAGEEERTKWVRIMTN